jgi:glutathione S-transferase
VIKRNVGDHEYFVGEGFTIADIALYAYTYVAPEGDSTLSPTLPCADSLSESRLRPGMIPITA